MKPRTAIQLRPPQRQRRRREMHHTHPSEGQPAFSSGRLEHRCALITGGDSEVGRSVALACAREGADITLAYSHELKAALETRDQINDLGRRCLLVAGQVDDPNFCRRLVDEAVRAMGALHILINNAADSRLYESRNHTNGDSLHRHSRTSVFSMFYITRAALAHLDRNGTIINTAFVASGRGRIKPHAVTPRAEEAIGAFTRSLARGLESKNIRVNVIAFDPMWTPLIPAEVSDSDSAAAESFPPAARTVAPWYVYLASEESSDLTGQVLHPHGGEISTLNIRFP